MSAFVFAFVILPVIEWIALRLFFVRPLHLPRPWAAALSVALLAMTQPSLWFALFGGNVFQPEMPRWLFYLVQGCAAFAFALLALSLLPPYGWWRIRAAVLAALALLAAIYSLVEGACVPRVATRDISLPGLPASMDGFRLVHLTDLHASVANRAGHFRAIVDRVNSLDPDVVCITGDFVDGPPEKRGDTLAPLSGLRARHGVFGCNGNHDSYSAYGVWRPILEGYGVRMLDYQAAPIPAGEGTGGIVIGGIPFTEWSSAPPSASQFRMIFADADPKAVRILLRHVPIGVDQAAEAGVALQLSGHTHGGQIPLLDLLIKSRNEGHVRGLYEENGARLFVSSGAGQWAGFPFRFGIPSEIALLRLHPASQ